MLLLLLSVLVDDVAHHAVDRNRKLYHTIGCFLFFGQFLMGSWGLGSWELKDMEQSIGA